MLKIADKMRYAAWFAFILCVFLALSGISWGILWWIALILAVGGYLLATIDITWKGMKI